MTSAGKTTPAQVLSVEGTRRLEFGDDLATEEPLEIRLTDGTRSRSVAVTMRTPGNDFELAAGFLFAEGIVCSRDSIRGLSVEQNNVVRVEIAQWQSGLIDRLERHFIVSSACGVCGKGTIDSLRMRAEPVDDDTVFAFDAVRRFPQRMREAQTIFTSTGGLHAAALFAADGSLVALREDVGRHNALDKLVGWALLNGHLPLRACALLVSGRASYELLQKSIVAGIPLVCAVSAPSSLAVDLARAFGVTLLGFLRDERANVYAAPGRIRFS